MGFQVTTSGSGGGGTPTQLYYPVTYAQAASAVAGSSVVRGATYFITDRNVELTGVAINAFSLEGRFLRSGEWNFIEYDFDNDHIQLEVDDRGNRVGCSALSLDYGLVTQDPRSVFRWGDDFCINNTVWNAEFICNTSTGQVYNNNITDGSVVNLSGDGNFIGNNVDGTTEITATSFTGVVNLVSFINGTVVDISGSSVEIEGGEYSTNCDIDFTAHTGTIIAVSALTSTIVAEDTCTLTNLVITGSQLLISGTSNVSNAYITQLSDIRLSDASDFSNCYFKNMAIISTGTVSQGNSNFFSGGVTFNNSGNGSGMTFQIPRTINFDDVVFTSAQSNVNLDTSKSNKVETFAVVANAIDFDAVDINRLTGNVLINSTDTINTISNLTVTIAMVTYQLAPTCFRITPTSGNTITFASATATNILLPNGVTTVTANGTNGDWIEFEHDGTNAYITEINNF